MKEETSNIKPIFKRLTYISKIIDKIWLIQDSPGLKLDWFEKNRIIFNTKPEHFIKYSLSNFFPQIGSNETGR